MPNINLRLEFHPHALSDLDEAADWYETQKIGLGYEFVKEFEIVTNLIKTFPNMFPVVENKIRKAILSRFPYLVFYKPYVDTIFIIAIMHSKRDPEYWKKRQ